MSKIAGPRQCPVGMISLASRPPQAFLELGFADNTQITGLASAKLSGITSSQPCEDTFNFQKNSSFSKGAKRFRRIEKVMAIPIAKAVMSKVHRFGELAVDEMAPCSNTSDLIPASSRLPMATPPWTFRRSPARPRVRLGTPHRLRWGHSRMQTCSCYGRHLSRMIGMA